MSATRKPFPFSEFEPRWQRRWESLRAFRSLNPGSPDFDAAKPKYYILDMFPYPSGEGLHVGHMEGYSASDILARFKRMCGFQVLHPMGWDAFGLPAEQFAIRTGQHPRVTTERNVARFRSQLKSIGLSYDWEREINTTDPAYVRWTQWIFLKLYGSWFDPEAGKARPIAELDAARRREKPDESEGDRRAFLDSKRLAFVSEAPVNWCPELGTVLANEEVIDGKSEIGGFPVERRPMRQWMLRITAYAERLLKELDLVEWPESIKLLQRNWIGKSEGAAVAFTIGDQQVEVFTTRPDTLFGATYLVLSPEHPLVEGITVPDRQADVAAYRDASARKSDLERTDLAKEKTGAFTGSFATNPVNGEAIPVWVADYVLMGYGTGAIMAVPAHDERDFEFARTFSLPIRQVVAPADGEWDGAAALTGHGIAVNSAPIDGLPTAEARARIIAWLEERGIGRRTVQYKLRDWLFSRQRYWGEPFPVVWQEGVHQAVPEDELPVLQPDLDDFRPTGTPEPPLSKARDWVRYSENAKRETNTMPQWAGSCWYYLRFCDPRNSERFVGEEAEKFWMGASGKPGGVDLYIGGTEHAVLHLLYARFWHKVLFDLGLVSTPEPFQRLVNQGIVLGPDGQKMSKSRGNVVSSDGVISEFGADSLRLYEMFMGPLEQMKPWSEKGIEGVFRFLARVWRLAMEETQEGAWAPATVLQDVPLNPRQERIVHATIKKVTNDLEELGFNTAIAQLMVFVNEFTNADPRPAAALRVLLPLLSPFAPHLADELWERLGAKFNGFEGFASQQPWPTWSEDVLAVEEVEIVVQVNGKMRDRLLVSRDAGQEEVERLALGLAKIANQLAGKQPRRVIVVPNKLVNVVV